ncbi:hypothetical protein RIF29_37894 [Crotalaria pallida]|uniref:CRIB domain-containing protein n=1 Tax=Crotalaria pallida TaxID=3830 RepID=A0AAN9DY44_CROPI
MSTKVKGLLKGLRYISQIFDEKEEEIQIGFPTDVKHVAHIGSDDPSANAPSWMNEYKGTSELLPGTEKAIEKLEEQNNNSSSKGTKIRNLLPKSRHHSIDIENNGNGNSDSTTKPKHTRRHRSSDPSSESSAHDSSNGSRYLRRHRRGANNGSESPSQDGTPPIGTKPRRKSKMASSEDGGSVRKPSSTRTSRRSSKGDSLTDIPFTDLGSGGIGSENGHESK